MHLERFGDALGTHRGRIGDALEMLLGCDNFGMLWEHIRDALGIHLGRFGDALGTHWRCIRDA